MFQEVLPEQHSDNGLDDIIADQHSAMQFYAAAVDALEFPPQSDAEEEPLPARFASMALDSDNSDDDPGGASNDESYGKVEETAPPWVLWFSILGLGLWLKLGFPSICLDYSLMGFYLWGCSRSR